MIDGHKVVTWTPYGREETMSILIKYMKRDVEAGVVDEYHLYMNTDPDQTSDVAYAEHLAETYDWVKLKPRPEGEEVRHPKQLNTGFFYRYAIEPDTVYCRFDDDIVYVHERAIERMVIAAIANRTVVTFPIIWHNSICSYYLQQMGKIPVRRARDRIKTLHCMDPIGWGNAQFAEKIHRQLLAAIEDNGVDQLFLHHDIQLPLGLQFSVSCFAAHSDLYRSLDPEGHLDYGEEEYWHTVLRPQRTGQANQIAGNALVAHLSFFPHTDYIRKQTDILKQYKALGDRLGGDR